MIVGIFEKEKTHPMTLQDLQCNKENKQRIKKNYKKKIIKLIQNF